MCSNGTGMIVKEKLALRLAAEFTTVILSGFVPAVS